MTIAQAYATLGLDAFSVTPDTARSRFRYLIRSNHPDGKPPHEQALANEKTLAIIEACVLLRKSGFLGAGMCGRAGVVDRFGAERMAASGPQLADPLEWLDDVWRECVRGNVTAFASPLMSVALVWSAWATGWPFMEGRRRK